MRQNLKLPRGCADELAIKYNISYRTVNRLWNQVKAGLENDDVRVVDISMKKSGNCGRKKKNRDELKAAIKSIHYKKRKTLRLLQESLRKKGYKIALSRVVSQEQGILCKKKTKSIRPNLLEEQIIRKDRLKFCLSKIDKTNKYVSFQL